MKTDIWFPLIIGDFLKFARNLTPAERGAWLNITIEMWLQDGWIDCTWPQMYRYAMVTEAEWEITRQVFSRLSLGSSQVFREDESGITQDWLLDELDKAKKRKNVSKSNGMKGGRPPNKPAGLSAGNLLGNLPGNLEHNLQITSSPSPSQNIEREAPAAKRERRQAEYTPSPESLGIFLLWKRSFPHDDAPKQQTCKNVTNRLKQHDRNHLVFSILKYASRVKKELAERPDNKMMTYKGSNFFGEKAYYESYLPSEADKANLTIQERIKAAIASVEAEIASLDKASDLGPAGKVVPPPPAPSTESQPTTLTKGD